MKPLKDASFLRKRWIIAIVAICVVAASVLLILELKKTPKKFAEGGGSICLETLSGLDTTGYIRLDVKYTTESPDKLKIFEFNLKNRNYRMCLSDKHAMKGYIKVGKLDTPVIFKTVARSSMENLEYTLSIKVYNPEGVAIGKIEKTATIGRPFITHVSLDTLKTK